MQEHTEQGDNITTWDISPIPAMREAGEVLFNCSILMRDGTWQHFDAGQRGGGYAHADEGDGGCLKRDAEMAWGSL